VVCLGEKLFQDDNPNRFLQRQGLIISMPLNVVLTERLSQERCKIKSWITGEMT